MSPKFASQTERRRHRRRKDTRPICVSDGLTVHLCALVDISASGARIRVGQGLRLAGQITLIAPESGLSQSAAIAWQAGGEIGVRFLEACGQYRILRSPKDLYSRAA